MRRRPPALGSPRRGRLGGRTRLKRLAIGLGALIVVGLAIPLLPTRERKLARSVDALLRGLQERDLDATAAVLAPDLRFEGPGEMGRGGRAEATARLKTLFAQAQRVRVRELDVRCDGDTGRVTATGKVTISIQRTSSTYRIAADLRFEEGESGYLLREAKVSLR